MSGPHFPTAECDGYPWVCGSGRQGGDVEGMVGNDMIGSVDANHSGVAEGELERLRQDTRSPGGARCNSSVMS